MILWYYTPVRIQDTSPVPSEVMSRIDSPIAPMAIKP